ncbi:hypothetical protein Tco_0368981 [Tanacetum coccineum]
MDNLPSMIPGTELTGQRHKATMKEELCKADLEGPAFNLVKAFHKNSVFLQYQMDECHKLLTNKVDLGNPEGHQILRNIYEPLPLGGPPGQVTIQPQFFFNKDLDYLLTGDKERKIALSISKLKADHYLDLGLGRISSILWLKVNARDSDREAVRSQMRILSVISVKVFEKYGYNYLREIILRRADYQEYKISEKDFKNLHPNDFEDLFLLNIQEKLNHLPKTDKTSLHTAVNMWIRNLVIRNRVGDLQLGIESYQTKINLERPNWDAADYYFKEDYTIVPKPRAVVYRDSNDQRKLMRLNELHKFSDGTLTRVMEKLDHMVKDFHLFEYNKGMETRKWAFTASANVRSIYIQLFWNTLTHDAKTGRSLLHDNIVPKPDLALELGKSISLTEAEEEAVTREVHATHARIVSDMHFYLHWIIRLDSFNKMEMERQIPVSVIAQDGDPLEDDVRFCLGDDLKKAQDHRQRQMNKANLDTMSMDDLYNNLKGVQSSKKSRQQEQGKLKKECAYGNIYFHSVGIKRLQDILIYTAARLQLLSDYYCWKDYSDRDEIKDLTEK